MPEKPKPEPLFDEMPDRLVVALLLLLSPATVCLLIAVVQYMCGGGF